MDIAMQKENTESRGGNSVNPWASQRQLRKEQEEINASTYHKWIIIRKSIETPCDSLIEHGIEHNANHKAKPDKQIFPPGKAEHWELV